MTRPRLTPARADVLAALLDVPLDCGICLACLSFVSTAVDRGDAKGVAREARRMTPDLWEEGLAEPALAAARRLARAGIPDGAVALADLEADGGRGVLARALVRRLAVELSRQVDDELRFDERMRRAGPGARPELNRGGA
jgi:hypothetical protein